MPAKSRLFKSKVSSGSAIYLKVLAPFLLSVGITVSPLQSQTAGPNISAAESAELVSAHPSAFYSLAAERFTAGDADMAVFWFYAGQLRYRFHLMANPDLPPDGDPALFASLSEGIGAPVNEYAFGDVVALAETIDAVLVWDEQTDNTFTNKLRHVEELQAVRQGLRNLQIQIISEVDAIREERERNGLANR